MRKALLLVVLLAAPAFAQDERGWPLLERITSEAPARQVGQPGNEWVDRWVEETFQSYVERSGGPGPDAFAAAQQTWDAAVGKLLESRSEIYLGDVSPALFASQAEVEDELAAGRASLTRAVANNPLPVLFVLTLALILLGVTWWIQRRSSLLIVAAGVLAVWIGIAVVGFRTSLEARAAAAGAGISPAASFARAAEGLFAAARTRAETSAGAWQRGRMRNYTAAFVPGSASLRADGGEARIYQLAPNLTDPANLRQPHIEAPVFYVGNGSFEELRPFDLAGAVVLIEFDSGRDWLIAAELGAEAIVFLEPREGESLSTRQAYQKVSNAPVSIPRFYVKRADVAALLGDGWDRAEANGRTVLLEQEAAQWQRTPVYTDWLFIPGSDPAADVSRLVHIQTFKDAASIVPELSPGAESAANLASLPGLLDRFLQQPPRNPVLVSVVNDHCNALSGEYNFASFAFTPPLPLADELDRLDNLHAQKLLVSQVYSQPQNLNLMEYMRGSIERVGGRSFTVKETAVNHLTMIRNTLRGEQNLLQFELQQGGPDAAERARIEARLEELRHDVEECIALLGLFNRFGHRTSYTQLTQDQKERLAEIFATLAADAARQAELLDQERRGILNNLGVRAFLSPPREPSRITGWRDVLGGAFPVLPSLAGFHLDLSLGSDELGLFFVGENRVLNLRQIDWGARTAADRGRRLARLFLQEVESHAAESGQPVYFRDTFLLGGSEIWRAMLGLLQSFGSSAFHQFANGAFTIAGVSDLRPVLFTPQDTIENIDRARFERHAGNVVEILTRVVNHPDLHTTLQTRGNSNPLAVEVTVRQMDRFSVGIPRTVLGNALVQAYPFRTKETEPTTYLGQVNRFPTTMADAFGRVTVRGELWRGSSLLAFGFDPEFRSTVAALDFGENEARFASSLGVPVRTSFAHRSIVTFECNKTDFLGFNDPLTFEPVEQLDVLDARNDSRPRHYSVAGIEPFGRNKRIPPPFDGAVSVFVEPDMPFKIRSQKVFAINTTPENIRGEGFASGLPLVRKVPWIMANDYQRLAQARLELLASKGVTSDTGDELNSEAVAVIAEAAAEPTQANRLILSEIARGLAFRAYSLTMGTIHDLVMAVVILLALVVPFCFFLVKLLSPFTDFNRQILLFMGVFAFFTVLLYFIQPAFAVGDRPQVIILAFVILGLALFVASVIIGKFDAAMNQAVEQMQLSESADAPQGRLAGTAFMVGVNNMKKRRIRTTLTCATIVLVTFTILSVISVREGSEPLRLRVGAEAPYDGMVFVRPGLGLIIPMQLSRLRAHFADRADTVVRTWSARQDEFGGYLPFRFDPVSPVPDATIENLQIALLLGLETGERDFVTDLTSPEYLLPGSRWFSADNAREMLISRRAAGLLGIPEDNFQSAAFLINGMELRLVGIFEDDAFADLRDLRKLPLLPLKVEATAAIEDGSAAMEGESDLTELPGVTVATGVEVVILPTGTAHALGGAENRVLGIKYRERDGESAEDLVKRMWDDIQRFLRYQQAYLAVGLTTPVDRGGARSPLDAGEYALASSTGAEIGGVLKIAIPVILAATIILNTMLGSVMERKKEISIYNAIGLNPSHVMVFFLAEAMVFGLVGSIAGYFIGQMLSVGLGQFIDLNLNYSSLSVMVVIFLTISTVMLSTLYPASMAAKAAVPSGQRKWSLPQPDGDQIHLRFPFSYDSRRVLAVCAYLYEFMKQNSEASTGKFLARLRAVGRVPSKVGTGGVDTADPSHHEALAMVFDVTPIPFDLGVNQKVEIYADYDGKVKAFMLSVHLTRESGEHHSWTTVNQPFLEALRKRLLGWRSQRQEVQESYFTAGEELFKNAAHLEVLPAEQAQT